MLQQLFKKKNFSATGATFIIFDTNGEYKQAFENLKIENSDIDIYYTSLNNEKNLFYLPHHFMNIEEWELLLQASEKAQLPILRNALGFATLFEEYQDTEYKKKIKNHIIASCILEAYNSSDSPVTKYQKIQSLFNKAEFDNYEKIEGYDGKFGNFVNKDKEEKFLNIMKENLLIDEFKIPNYKKGIYFDFEKLIEYLELAILYEEANGNRQIRNFCASLLTRAEIIKHREDFHFLRKENEELKNYLLTFLGINKEDFTKKTQITIIDLNEVEDEIVEIISSVFTRIIFDFLKKQRNRNIFPINLILEEAHRYIAYDSKRTFLRASQIFDRVAKEGRKYGLFLMISSQRPSELSKTVLSQCNNFIVHRIQNPDDLLHIRQITPHISDTILKKLPSIPTQHALIFGNAVNIPALFKVNEANPLPKSDNNEVSNNWFVERNKDYKFLFEEKENNQKDDK